jgi:hypothetical protein
MKKLELARARLDRALDRLEMAQQAFDDRVRVIRAAVTRGADWQELIRAVDDVQKENQALVAREERLRNRVDKAIERLSAVLDAHPEATDARSAGGDAASKVGA